MCGGVLSACLSVNHMYAWHQRRPEESVRSQGTGLESCEPPALWMLGINFRSSGGSAIQMSHLSSPNCTDSLTHFLKMSVLHCNGSSIMRGKLEWILYDVSQAFRASLGTLQKCPVNSFWMNEWLTTYFHIQICNDLFSYPALMDIVISSAFIIPYWIFLYAYLGTCIYAVPRNFHKFLEAKLWVSWICTS